MRAQRSIIALWGGLIVLALWIVFARTTISADLVAFLPRSATPTQQLLVDQLREGVASRLVLFAIEGGTQAERTRTSRALVRELEDSGHFSYINNGEQRLTQADGRFLFEHRYLLSPQVTPAHFSVEELRQALQTALGRLASSGGMLYQRSLAQDPTGEIYAVIQPLLDANGPAVRDGVWVDIEGERALLMAETRAAGFDMDAQQAIQHTIADAFERARADAALDLLATGPSIFAVQSRAAIEQDAWRLSLLAVCGVSIILLVVYRSAPLLGLAMLPVASGVLAGIAAVSLGFDTVHGITLGFGATLIGEAVDYPTYVLTQIRPGETVRSAAHRVWPTLRMAVLTTVFGSLAMLLSSFQGLAQLGLFSLVGVLTAGLVTRFVLPQLVPAPLRSVLPPPAWAGRPWRLAPGWRVFALFALGSSLAFLVGRGPALWENDLAKLNPISSAARELDQQLREAMGAPDVRLMYAAQGESMEAALQRAEALAPHLQRLRERGVIGAYDSPAFYLPSQATQEARRQALPDAETLRERLATAGSELPFREDLFEPFVADVQAARAAPLLTMASFAGTGLELKLRTLLSHSGDRWTALLPLSGVQDAEAVIAAARELPDEQVFLLDLKTESDRMVTDYRNESLVLWLIGTLAVALVLWFGLRRLGSALAVLIPVLCAVFTTAALLALFGLRLNLFHLISLLLVVGVGVNYALFFNRGLVDARERARNVRALFVCNATTVCSFGVLSMAGNPVLQSIGMTVGLGAVLSLVYAILWGAAAKRS